MAQHVEPWTIVRSLTLYDDVSLDDILSACYRLHLGVRASNVETDGTVAWLVNLYEANPPRTGSELRAWDLPAGIPLIYGWNSVQARGHNHPTTAAKMAAAANRTGRWARLHTVLDGPSPGNWSCGGTVEWVVDVLAADPPVER